MRLAGAQSSYCLFDPVDDGCRSSNAGRDNGDDRIGPSLRGKFNR